MIDLHQGINGGELSGVAPRLSELTAAQLDVCTALLKGQWARAARCQWQAARTLAGAARELLRERRRQKYRRGKTTPEGEASRSSAPPAA